MGSSLEAVKIVSSSEGDDKRAALKENTTYFSAQASAELGIDVPNSHIVPIIVGDSARAVKAGTECLKRGVVAHGIRYPSVSEETARLRFTLMSDHTREDLDRAVSVLGEVLEAV